MNRAMYMSRLRELLSDITEAEREEALNYYEDYFDDAGVENESAVIESLGTPEKVAATIKDGLSDHEGANGEYSEYGYTNGTYEDKDEVVTFPNDERGFGRGKMGSGLLIILLILCIFALPILGPVLVGIASAVFGILCAVFALLFAAIVAGVGLLVGGVAVVAAAIPVLMTVPVVGVLLLGLGMILGGVGVLLCILGVWFVKKVVPLFIRGFVNICRKPFVKKNA